MQHLLIYSFLSTLTRTTDLFESFLFFFLNYVDMRNSTNSQLNYDNFSVYCKG